MLKLTPLLLAALWGFVYWRFSAWRLSRELDEKSAPLMDPKLAPVLARLASALQVPRIVVHIYEVAPVNGLAAPDGRIFLTRGFYDRYVAGQISGDEIASVVAHELGHVALGHTRRRMIDFSGQNALRMAMATVLGRYLPGVGTYIAGFLTQMLAAKLSRKDEFAADAYASALLMAAGIGTAPQVALFGKLDALTGAMGAGPPAWLRSHPKSDQRIAAIAANAAKWQAIPPDKS